MSKSTFDEILRKAVQNASAGRHKEAVRLYEKALEHDPDHQPSLVNIADSLNQIGEHERAIRFADRAIASGSEKSSGDAYLVACVNKAIALANLQRLEEAIPLFAMATEKKPENEPFWSNLCTALHTARHFGDEIECYDKMLVRWPDLPWALWRKGMVLADELDQPNDAIAYFRKAILGYESAQRNAPSRDAAMAVSEAVQRIEQCQRRLLGREAPHVLESRLPMAQSAHLLNEQIQALAKPRPEQLAVYLPPFVYDLVGYCFLPFLDVRYLLDNLSLLLIVDKLVVTRSSLDNLDMAEATHLGYGELPRQLSSLLKQADLFHPVDVAPPSARTLGRWVVSAEAPIGDPVAESLRSFYQNDRYGEGWTTFAGLNVHTSSQGNEDFIRVAMAEVESNLCLSRAMKVPFVVDQGLYRAYAERVKRELVFSEELIRLVQANFKRVLDEVFSVMLPEIRVKNARRPSGLDQTAAIRLVEKVLDLRQRPEIAEFKKWLRELQTLQEENVPRDLRRASYVSRKVTERIATTQARILEACTSYNKKTMKWGWWTFPLSMLYDVIPIPVLGSILDKLTQEIINRKLARETIDKFKWYILLSEKATDGAE